MLFETSLGATPVFGLRREMNRLFDDMLTRTTPSTTWAPPVDVREDDREIALQVELPGVKPENVDVTCDNGILTVHGEKRVERKEGTGEQYHLLERTYGTFTRQFRLPKGVDESKITADFEHGVLSIRVPKAALPQPKKIQIGVREDGEQRVSGTQSNRSTPNAQMSNEGKGANEPANAKS